MQIKKIFLASSEELKDDRRSFELMLGRLNQDWRSRDINFDLVVWENFIDSMSKEGLQNEYNNAIKECDIFVMMFFTKVGPYTLSEFETAFADLKAGTGPYIYTFFRNDIVMTGQLGDEIKSLLEFKARLRDLKHYPTLYRNTEDLQWQFSRQLEKLYGGDGSASIEITDGTPEWRVAEIALVLTNRQLYGDAGAIEATRLNDAVARANQQVRYAIMTLAQEVRRQTWLIDKYRMERTIPVFEALCLALPKWHEPFGALAYALKDKRVPEWKRALALLEKAIKLRGGSVNEGYFYTYCRAACLIALDEKFGNREAADAETRANVIAALRTACSDIGDNWNNVLANPDATDIRLWLEINGSPKLR